MKPTNALFFVLLLLLLAGGVYFATSGGSNESPNGPGNVATTDAESDRAQVSGPLRQTSSDDPRSNAPRSSGPTRVEVSQGDGADFDQGITGQMIDDTRRPVVGASVYLFESYGNNPFAQMMEMANGVVKPPLAVTTTANDGTFELGLSTIPEGKTYELRAVSDYHGELTRPNMTLFPGKWWDAGVLTMERGVEVYGVITDEQTGAPLADVSVFLKSMSAQMTSAPTPGRERGTEVLTDAGGNYRFFNAGSGMHALTAVRAGYAQVEKNNINVRRDADNRLDFELPVGLSLGGMVTDGDGNPIAGARVQAHALSSKSPLTVTERTLEDGSFNLIGLVDSPFALNVSAQGYVTAKVDAVQPGTTDELVVLEQQCSVKIKVLSDRGRRLDGFTTVVKNWVAAQEQIGNIPGLPAHKVSGRDLDQAGFYEVTGLNPGSYKLEVRARGYAKTYSESFELSTGDEAPLLEVRVNKGGQLSGIVLGADGAPLAGAQVKTLPNTYEDNAITGMFGALIPFEISRRQIKTDANGKFRMALMAPGTYQLQFNHPEHYGMNIRDVVVELGSQTDAGEIRMQRGTLLYGTATVDGVPMAQIKVMVSAKPDPENPGGTMFSSQAVTDAEGRFLLPKRLPPGEYSAQAGRQGSVQDIFTTVLDYQRTRQEFIVGAGTQQQELHFQLQSNPAPAPTANPPGQPNRR